MQYQKNTFAITAIIAPVALRVIIVSNNPSKRVTTFAAETWKNTNITMPPIVAVTRQKSIIF